MMNLSADLRAGEVALVGAGPGDPELLTLAAYRCLQQADVVLYDRLVAADILALIPRRVQRLCVGKARGRHSFTQEAINRLLVRLARRGLKVCRLKGGDPFVFGRGGEEALVLAAHQIPFRVVPGITAAAGATAAAAIPLTQRGLAHAVTLITGQRGVGQDGDSDWSVLAQSRQTLVFYMALAQLDEISTQLCAHGLDPDTPAALIENGTRPEQRVLVGRLAELPLLAVQEQVSAPALVVIGAVVSLREQLLHTVLPAAVAAAG